MKKMIWLLVLMLAVVAGIQVASAQEPGPNPVSIATFKARTQVAVGFQSEWLTRAKEGYYSPRQSWVAVIPASYNLTPRSDIVAQAAYNMTTKETRWMLGARVVLIGK